MVDQTCLPSLLLGDGGCWCCSVGLTKVAGDRVGRCGTGCTAFEVQNNISKNSPGSSAIHPHTMLVSASVNPGKLSHYVYLVVAHSQNFSMSEG